MKTLFDKLTDNQLETILKYGETYTYTCDKVLKILARTKEIDDLTIEEAKNISLVLTDKSDFSLHGLIKLFNN